MAEKKKKIRIGIDFDIQHQKLKSLKAQLQGIQQLTPKDIMATTGQTFGQAANNLREVRARAAQVEQALRKAFNPKLNTTNIERFKQELGLSGKSLRSLREEFSKIGPQGELAFSRIESKVLQFGNTTRQTHNILSKMGTTLVNSIKWTIASSLVNNFTSSIQQAWGFTKSLDNSLNDIRIVTGKNADEMARFADKANAAAKSLGRTTTDYTKASLIYSQQGLNDVENQARTRVTLKAANVTGQSAEEVSEELTAVWNGYKVSADEAEIYVDRLAAVAASTASDLQELSTGMSKVASAAASLGVGEDQLAAQLSTIISVTRQAPETVGTALKTVYARITDIQAGVEEDGTTLGMYSGKLAEMGINVLDTAGNLRNMGTVIEEVGNKWAKFSREQQIYIAQTMAGQRQYSNLISLFDNFDKYNEAMQVADKSAGTLSKQQDIYMDSINAHMNQLTSSTEKMWKSMIDSESMKKLLDFLSGLTDSVGWFIDSLGGGGNVLLTLGNIATTVFQRQMATGLAKTIFNFNQMRLAAIDSKAKIADINLQLSQLGNSDADKITRGYLERQKQIYEANKLGILPQDQVKKLYQSNEALKTIDATMLAISKTQEQAKRKLEEYFQAFSNGGNLLDQYFQSYNAEKSTDFAGIVNNTIQSYEYLFNQIEQMGNQADEKVYQKSMNRQDFFNVKKEEIEAQIKTLEELQSSTANGQQKEVIQQQIKELRELAEEFDRLNKISNPKQKITDKSQESIDQFLKLKQVAIVLKQLKDSGNFGNLFPKEKQVEIEAFLTKIDEIQKKIESNNFGSKKNPSENVTTMTRQASRQYEELGETFKKTQQANQGLKASLENSTEAQKQASAAAKAHQAELQNFTANFSKMSFAQVATQITGIASGMMQALTISNQLTNAIGIWGKESVSTGEKVKKVLAATLTSFTTLLPQVIKNTQQLQLYFQARKAEKKGTQAATAATNADTAAKNQNKLATDSAKASTVSFMAFLGPVVALASIAIGVISGVVQGIVKAVEENRKAVSERNKQAIELNEKLVEEAKNYNKLSQSLDELNKKYKEGSISRAEVGSQIDELCQQYNLEGNYIEKLIRNYNDLEDAIKQVQKASVQQLLQSSKAAANIARNELLDNQTKEKINFGDGNNYGRSFYTYGLSKQQIAYIQKNFGGKYNSKYKVISFKADSNNTYDLANFQQNMVNMAEYLAAEAKLDTPIYKEVKSFNDYAKQHGQESLINAANEQINGIFQQAILNSGLNESNSLLDFSKKIQDVISDIENNTNLVDAWANQGLDANEQIRTNILKAIKTINPDIYSQYAAKQASFSRVTEKLTNGEKQQAQKRYQNLSPAAIQIIESLNYSLEDIKKNYKDLIQVKDTFEQTKSVEQLATAYQNLDTVLEKINKGQKVSKDEYQNIKNIIGEDEAKGYFDVDVSGKNYIFKGDPVKYQEEYRKALAKNHASTIKQNKDTLTFLQNVNEDVYNKNLADESAYFVNEDNLLRNVEQVKSDITYSLPSGNHNKLAFLRLSLLRFHSRLPETLRDKFLKDEDINSFIEGINNLLESGQPIRNDTVINFKNRFTQLINSFASKYSPIKDRDRQDMILQGLENAPSFEVDGIKYAGNSAFALDFIKKLKNENNRNNSALWEQAGKAYSTITPEQLTNEWRNSEKTRLKEENIEAGRLLHQTLFGQKDSDTDTTNLATLTQTIKKAAGETDELSNGLKDNFYWSRQLADSILRFDNGLEDSAKNLLALQEQLQSGSLTSLAPVQNIYQDILGLSDQLSDDFLKNNLNLIHTIVFGTFDEAQSAYSELQKKIADTIFTPSSNNKERFENAANILEKEISSLKIGDEIEEELINPILGILNAAGLTARQIKDFFASKFNIEVRINGDDPGAVSIADSFIGADFVTKWKNVSTATKDAVSSAEKRINKETQLTKLLDKEVDIYHDINIELNLIDKRLSRLQKIQKNLSGAELLNNLQEQTKVLAEQNKKLKEKQQLQRQDLLNQSSILRGLGATFNADGSIANYSSLYGSAINSVNDVIRQIREKETSSYGMDTSSSEYKQIEDEIKELKQEQNKRQEHLDNVEKYINKYDSARNSLFDLVDKIEDSARAAIELNLQIFQAKVQIKLDLTQAQRDWEHFVSETLNRDDILNPNSFNSRQRTVELAFKDIKYFDEDYKNLSDQFKRYQEEIKKFQQARLNGTTYQSELFNSQSEALAAAEQTGKKMQEAVTSYADSIDTIKQAILDAYEDVSEIFSKNNDIYTFIKNQLNHDIQLVDLLEGGRGGRLKDSLYAQISQTDIENIKQLRTQADYWANEQAKATDEATRKLARQKWQETIESINSATEEGVQTLKSKYENLIDTVSQEMEDKLTNGFGFDYFSTEWDRVKERTNSYLDPVNAAFAIRDTEFNYQKAINDADGLLTQQKLRKVMEQQLNILKQKDKLTQYDVDRANKVLEVEKARMALEEARNNKTTLRLKRDSQGNYSYQFTADAEAIEEAQNKLDKAKNDLYNLDLKAYQDNADKVIKLTQDTQKKIQEIMKDQNLTEEQRKQALLELQEWYQEQLTFLTQENTSIRNNLMQSATDAMSNSFNQGKIDFENMIGGWNSNTQKWINELVKNPDSAFEIMKQGIQEMEQASKQFKDKSNEYLDQAKDTYKAFKENGIDPLVKSEKEVVDSVESLIEKINKITETAQTWRTGLGTVANGFDTIKTSAENAGEAILRFKAALAGSGQKDNKGNDTSGAQYGNGVSDGSITLPSHYSDKSYSDKNINTWGAPEVDNEGREFVKYTALKQSGIRQLIERYLEVVPESESKKYWDQIKQGKNITRADLANIQDIIEKEWPLWMEKAASLTPHMPLGIQDPITRLYRRSMQALSDPSFYGSSYVGNPEKVFNLAPKKFVQVLEILLGTKKELDDETKNLLSSLFSQKSSSSSFNTGGYTGSWNSSQGKIAILHEKELILNKDDTQNMLNMLKITRDTQTRAFDYSSIFNAITNNLTTIIKEITLTKMQNDFNNIMESQLDMLKYKSQTGTTSQGIEQQVKIEANFPNVNSKEEIEAALSDLVNMAAQRALKINKN